MLLFLFLFAVIWKWWRK